MEEEEAIVVLEVRLEAGVILEVLDRNHFLLLVTGKPSSSSSSSLFRPFLLGLFFPLLLLSSSSLSFSFPSHLVSHFG